MLVILAVLKDPDHFSSNSFPKNPCLIVICPTIPLQLEMVSKLAISVAELLYLKISKASKMSKVGLEVIVINSSTQDETSRHQQEELWVTARTSGNIIVASPEQLKSKEFEKTVLDSLMRFFGQGHVGWASMRSTYSIFGDPVFERISFKWAL